MNISKKYIHIERIPYEEPYNLNLILTASNGKQTGEIEIYVCPEHLSEFAENIIKYPNSLKHEYTWEFGSQKPEDNFAFYLKLHLYPLDARGNCRIIVSMNNNEADAGQREISHFTMDCRTEELNVLSDLLSKLSGAAKQGLKSGTLLEWNGLEGSVN